MLVSKFTWREDGIGIVFSEDEKSSRLGSDLMVKYRHQVEDRAHELLARSEVPVTPEEVEHERLAALLTTATQTLAGLDANLAEAREVLKVTTLAGKSITKAQSAVSEAQQKRDVEAQRVATLEQEMRDLRPKYRRAAEDALRAAKELRRIELRQQADAITAKLTQEFESNIVEILAHLLASDIYT